MKTIEQAREMIKKGLANSLEGSVCEGVYKVALNHALERETSDLLLADLLCSKSSLANAWLLDPRLIADGVAVYEHIMRGVEDRYAKR